MAWRRTGDKPLSEPILVCCTDAICIARPQWVNRIQYTLEIWWSDCGYYWLWKIYFSMTQNKTSVWYIINNMTNIYISTWHQHVRQLSGHSHICWLRHYLRLLMSKQWVWVHDIHTYIWLITALSRMKTILSDDNLKIIFNSFWTSESTSIRCQRIGSTLVEVKACCLMATNHYLNQNYIFRW